MPTNEENTQLAELEAKMNVLEAALLEKDEEIKALKAKSNASLKTAAANKGGQSFPVTVNKKKYLVVHNLNFSGQKMTAEEIAKDKELVAMLVAEGSTAVIEA